MKFNPTTPVKFYKKTSTYVAGQGPDGTWAAVLASALYCEWKGGYGERAMAAEAAGVSDMATIRTFYHPDLYAALKSVAVVVVKNADATAIVGGVPDPNNPNLYELWGGVDNVREENQYMEFRVRRYEVK